MLNQVTRFGFAFVLTAICLVSTIAFKPLFAQDTLETPYVSWSPDGQLLAVGLTTQIAIYSDLGTLVGTIPILETLITEPVWANDNHHLAVIDGGDVQIWHYENNPLSMQLQNTIQYYINRNPPVTSAYVYGADWSEDNSRIALLVGKLVRIFDVNTGDELSNITGDWSILTDITWSPDNRIFFSSVSRYVLNANPQTGEITNVFFPLSNQTDIPPGFWSIALSPDGSKAVGGLSDGGLLIWGNTNSQEFLNRRAELELGNLDVHHSDVILSLSWSPTGQYIASSSRDGTIRIWDAATGEQLDLIDFGAGVQVNSVAFSPDGSQLAYGNPDGSFILYDATQLPNYQPLMSAAPTLTP
jgi:WD40 repeat protein